MRARSPLFGVGLMVDARLVLALGERLWRHPAAGVAVDAAGIDVEIPGALWDKRFEVCAMSQYSPGDFRG
jgi:hypothetical protein